MSTFATPRIIAEQRPDRSTVLRSTEALQPHEAHLGVMLRHWAAATPDTVLAADRSGAQLTYGYARPLADSVAQVLLKRGLGPDRPLMVLSGNSVGHLLVTLGAYTAGVPVVPVSEAYSLLSADQQELRAMTELVRPGLVFAADGHEFGAAVQVLGVPSMVGRGPGDLHLDASLSTEPKNVDAAFDAITPDSVAKILFTSGSTGVPKAVVNTHRMLCSNQQMMRQVWPFVTAEPPVLVDWLPWSHTFGGNHNLHLVLANGGTLHIDDGRPLPEEFERTVEALWKVAPTAYFTVPDGYEMLVPRLEADEAFARHFFSRLRLLCYTAGALPQTLWDRLERLVERHADHPVPLTSSWGTTETAPAATSAHWAGSCCGCIGVPLPGVTVKLVPVADKREIRVTGENVTPGYLGQPGATAEAFDEGGFFRTGDAAVMVDEDDPSQGLLFDGRIAAGPDVSSGPGQASVQ